MHGDVNRLSLYQHDFPPFKKLSLGNVVNVTKNDLVIITRAWSPVFEFVFNYINNRPTIIQVSDGLVFDLNSSARKNQRYGGLYKTNLFDETILLNESSIKLPYRFSISSVKKNISQLKNVLLVLGNDFYFDENKHDVVISLVDIKSQYIGYEYYVSVRDRDVEALFLNNGFKVANISDFVKEETLVVSTPSTFLLELSQEGFLVSLHKRYYDQFFDSFLVSHELALQQLVGSDVTISKRSMNLNVEKRTAMYAISKRYFLRYLIGDLRELLRC